jgi:hypothetical protein
MAKKNVSARNKAGKRLKPGGSKWFSKQTLAWLRKRKAGVKKGSVRVKKQPLRLRALSNARHLLGVVERGGNNTGPVVDRIIRANNGSIGEPWCGDFVAYVYRNAGSKSVQRAWAATRFLGRIAGQSSRGRRSGEPGDIVVFDFPGGHPDSDHTGLLVAYVNSNKRKVPAAKATHIKTLDGNVGISANVSDSKTGGDGVGYKVRPIRYVSRIVKVKR